MSEELDETGLYDYHARLYDPTLERFISADTIVPHPGDPQSLNRYSYVMNNPVNFTDPTGHCMVSALKRSLIPGAGTLQHLLLGVERGVIRLRSHAFVQPLLIHPAQVRRVP